MAETQRTRRWPVILGILLLGGLVAPTTSAQAEHTSPTVTCNFLGIGVMTPGPLGEGEGGTWGSFGGASIGGVFVGSKLVCSGALNGVAELSGSFSSCAQIDEDDTRHPDSTPWTDPVPAPALAKGGAAENTGFECGGEYAWDSDHPVFTEDLADGFPFNVHTGTAGELTGLGWVWDDGSPGPPDCDLAASGHAPFPTELQILISCPKDTPTHLITVERPTNNASVLLFGAAADLFHVNPADGPDFQHCEVNDTTHLHMREDGSPTTQTWVEENNPSLDQRARCLRAVIFNGVHTGTVETLP